MDYSRFFQKNIWINTIPCRIGVLQKAVSIVKQNAGCYENHTLNDIQYV